MTHAQLQLRKGSFAPREDKMRTEGIQLKFGFLALGLLVAFPGLAKADVRFNFTTIDVPLCGPLKNAPCKTSEAFGNSTNAIVGDFNDDAGNTHGFVLSRGAYTQIDVPDAIYSSLNGIDSSGRLAGTYINKAGQTLAFFFDGSSFITLDPVQPPAGSQGGFINAQGQVVGTYLTKDSKRHGFIWRLGSLSFPINVPHDDPILGTILFGINDRGQIVGTYVDDGILGNERHAFFRDSAGNYTTLDAPGSICFPSPPLPQSSP
jgi:hypothetical protein